MLNTLRQYLYSGRSVRKTAEKLFIHRNTVAYRVGKATQRLNISLDDGRAFRRLSISLQILEYLDRDRYFGSADES